MSDNVIRALVESEFKGALSKTLAKQGKEDFSLLLAMLQQDITNKLKLTQSEPDAEIDTRKQELAMLGRTYPETPLSAEKQHWINQVHITQAMATGDLANARLMQQMHPPPLALQNDPAFISEEIVANCDIFCQERMLENKSHEKEVDPTLLYDIVSQSSTALTSN